MNAATIPQAVGDWLLKHRDVDQVFAYTQLSDACIDAANRAGKQFDGSYPGWQVYSRMVRGDTMFDRQLTAWAIGCARAYVRGKKINGHAVVAPRGRRNDWVAQAGVDALEFVIFGKYDEAAHVAAGRLDVWAPMYRKVRKSLTALMIDGFANYHAELHYQYMRVMRENREIA
jgi:hypothetical protein